MNKVLSFYGDILDTPEAIKQYEEYCKREVHRYAYMYFMFRLLNVLKLEDKNTDIAKDN